MRYLDLAETHSTPLRREKRNYPSKSQRKPLRIFLYLLIAMVFFFVGYGTYYAVKLGQFVVSTTGAQISQTFAQHTTGNTLSNQTNILLLGSDNDQKFTGNPLTQTMMVVHINFDTKEVDLFSIPRDLWVKIPDTGRYGKIDQAAGYGGIPSAVSVVEGTFGISVDHYAWVGLEGFIKGIDILGGVNLNVIHPVLDDTYPADINSVDPYGYKRLDIQPGMQHLDGASALEYVRSRHEDLVGDFGRIARQQQLLLAVKQDALSSPATLVELPNLLNELQSQVKTDISPTLGIQLGAFFLTNKNLNLKQYNLSPPTYSTTGNSTDGQSIVIGNALSDSHLIGSIFGSSAEHTTYASLANEQGIVK